MKLHLIRHAETVWHEENKYSGHTDIELTNLGHAQAKMLATWAVELKPKAIYSSDLIRAIDTAKPSAHALGLQILVDSRFREVNFGQIEGLTPIEMDQQFHEVRQEFLARPADTKLPDGESGRLALQRALPAVDEILSDLKDIDVMLVSHGTLIRLLVCHLLGIDLNQYRQVLPSFPNIARITLSITSTEVGDSGNRRVGLLAFER
jgi:broad specificity phosphatase PhoE